MNFKKQEKILIKHDKEKEHKSLPKLKTIIILSQIIISGIIPYYIITFNITQIEPLIFSLKIFLSISSFLTIFMLLQGTLTQLILSFLKNGTNKQFLLEMNSVSTLFILPLIPSSSINKFFLKIFGAKIGKNVFISYNVKIANPHLIEIGNSSFIGHGTGITGHIYNKNDLLFNKVIIGKNVFIGAYTLIFPGTKIGNGAIIGALSLIQKNKRIPKKTVWGGVPVKKIEKF